MAIVDNAVSALRRAERDIEGQLASVREAIASLTRSAGRRGRAALLATGAPRQRRKLSADARARISAAQKRRWAKHKAENKK